MFDVNNLKILLKENKKNLFIFSTIFSIFITSNLIAGVSTPTPSNNNLIAKIANATSYTSKNNNNININSLNKASSSIISEKQLRENITQDAAALGLKVDEKAITALTSGGNFSTAGLDNLGDDPIGFGILETPDPTPETYVYDTGVMTLTMDSSYADKGIFSTADGAQKGRVQVFINFNKKLFWGDVIAYPTLAQSNSLQDGSTDYSNPSLGTATITSLPVTGNTSYTIRYGIDGMTGSVTDDSACADSSCRTNATTLNMEDGSPNDGDNSIMKKYMNHNGTISNSGNSYGGIVVHGEFATATLSSNGTATIAFEAADCNGCNDSDFAGSIERWSATGTTTTTKGKGVNLPRTQVSNSFASD